jgi:hypothetical protein
MAIKRHLSVTLDSARPACAPQARLVLPTPHGRRAPAPGETHWMSRLAPIVYVVLGVIVASQHSYYAHLGSLSQVLSAVVATALWPLVLLGANLHLSLANL